MAFPPSLLTDDEEIAVDLRPHWWYITPASFYLAVAVIIGLFVLIQDWPGAIDWIVGLAILAALGYFAVKFSQWATTNFVVTNERVISRSGVVSKNGIEIPLDRINTVFFNQSVFERLLGAGDLAIESAGERGRQTFADIRKPASVQQEIYRQAEAFEARRIDRMGSAMANRDFPSAPAPPTASIPEQIEQLDRLRQSGAITQAEFDDKKAELLRRL